MTEDKNSTPIEIVEKPLTTLAKSINATMTRKGFWEDTRNIPYLMATQGGFTAEQVESVRKAFRSQKLALITSELSEALESDRKDKVAHVEAFKEVSEAHKEALALNSSNESEKAAQELFIKNFEATIKDSFGDELADALIRILDLAGGEEIDLDFHVAQKMKYNETRAKMHGKKF